MGAGRVRGFNFCAVRRRERKTEGGADNSEMGLRADTVSHRCANWASSLGEQKSSSAQSSQYRLDDVT